MKAAGLLCAVCLTVIASAFAGDTSGQPALKDVFKNDFLIGMAVNDDAVSSKEPQAKLIVEKHCNTITPENVMKWQFIHPEPNRYDFAAADRFVEFGRKNKMFIVGHILIDIAQVPDWVFKDSDGNTVSRETLFKRIREHTFAVVGHYKGQVNAWHVINEAIGRDGKMRKTRWFEILGDDYIEKVFGFAHEADPNVELYYNGQDMLTKESTDSIIHLAGVIKKGGGRIDGIGVQAHWGLDEPPLNEVEDGIVRLAQSGVKIMITEMDITVLPVSGSNRQRNPYPGSLPDEVQEKLANRYGELFSIFHKHADKIDRVNFWGVHDGQSWLNYWPIQGRTNYPLLFDRNYQPKPAFYAVVKTAEQK